MKPSRPAATFATASILLIVACSSATSSATSSPVVSTPPPATATSSPRSDPTSSPGPSATAMPTPLPVLTHQPTDFEPSFTLAAPSDWRVVDVSTEHYVVAGPDSVGTIVLQANPVIASDANGCEGLAAVDGATTVDGIVAAVLMNSKLVTSTSVMTVDGHEGQESTSRSTPVKRARATGAGVRRRHSSSRHKIHQDRSSDLGTPNDGAYPRGRGG